MEINSSISESLKKCLADPNQIMEADLNYFYPDTKGDRVDAFKQVTAIFCNNDDEK